MTNRIESAHRAIATSGVLKRFANFDPHPVSTILVGLDTPDSDIDVVCSWSSREVFRRVLAAYLDEFGGSPVRELPDALVGSFCHAGFELEIYASGIPVEEQMGWRHFEIMRRIVAQDMPGFVEHVRALRTAGSKTEPALCEALGLEGVNPYVQLLELESWSDDLLQSTLVRATQNRP